MMKSLFQRSMSILGGVILSVFSLAAQENADFYCPYDFGLDIKNTGGTVKGILNPKGSFKLTELLLPDGIVGKALLIGRESSRDKQYSAKYNSRILSAQSGTISFWIKPLDWGGADKEFFKMFFSASGLGQQIYIYKYINRQKLFFYCSSNGKVSVAECSIANWSPNEWHHIACIWSKSEIVLYVDGAKAAATALKSEFKTDFTSFTVGSLGWAKEKGTSLLDELKIYKTALPSEKIRQEYNKYSADLVREKSPVNIAVGKRTPVPDGRISRFEYSFGGTGFFNLVGKKYAPVQSRYYLSYDDDYLYVGVTTPAGSKIIADKMIHDENLWEDDSIEIYLYADRKNGGKYQFVFNSKGVFYDSKNRKAAWNIKGIKLAGKVQDGQWVFEVAFPWEALKVGRIAAGESWKLNICRSFRENGLKTTLGPCNMAYNDAANFAKMTFVTGIPLVDIETLGALNNNILDFRMNIMSTVNTEAVLKLNSPRKVLPYSFAKSVILLSGKTEKIIAETTGLPPNNVLNVDLGLKGGKELYQAAFGYRDVSPISVSYIYTDAAKQILNLVCSDNGNNSSKDNSLVMKMLSKNGRVIVEREFPLNSKNMIFTIPFSIAELPPGEYKFVVNCVDKSGKVLLNHWEMYCKPAEHPSWNNTMVGAADKVPWPWTSITADKDNFECWGRNYCFKGSSILSSLKSQGRELLAEPIRVSVNGQNASVPVCNLISRNEATATYRLNSKTNSVKLNVAVKAEFDGFLWVDLEYEPILNKAEINTMTLDIPLKRENISGFDNCQSLKEKVDLNANANRIIYNDFAKMPACWIGGDDVGLMIGAKNLKGWYVKNKKRSMEIIPGDKNVVVRLNLVDTPLRLTGKRHISFYLEATPTKPLNRKAKSIRNEINTLTWSGYWFKYYNYFIIKYLDWDKINRLKQLQKRFKLFYYSAAHGASPYSPQWNYYGREWHSAPPALGEYCVDSDVSSKVLRNRNTFTYGCLDCKSFFDFNLATLAEVIKRPDIRVENLYIDLAWPKMCSNKNHGCGYVDEFGEKQSSFDIIGTREYYKRLYRVLKDKNPEAMICMHIVRTRTPADSFADLLVFGEGYDRDVAMKESYYDVLNPELVRIAYASRGKEQEIWLIPQFMRGFLLFRPERAKTWKPEQPEAERAVKHFIGYMTVHNISFMRGIDTVRLAKRLYDAQDWLGWQENVEFFPYWNKNKNPVEFLSGKSDRVLISTFRNKNKAMLAILNDTAGSRILKIKLSENFLRDKNKSVKVPDAMDKNSIEYIINNGILELKIPARGFKLLLLGK